MAKLIVYNTEGHILRVMSSSRPKEDWDLSIYGLTEQERMKLFADSELPNDFEQAKYLYDEATQSFIPNPDYTPPYDPTPDQARLTEIVATSPQVITMPDMWEAIRILARLIK